MLLTLAQTAVTTASTATTGPAGTPPPTWFQMVTQFFPFVVIAILWVVLTGGTKRKTERERRNLLDNLKKGDRIKLVGGEYGAVVEVKETKVLVKVDEGSNTKIWYARDAVAGVEKEETPATK